jgi:photosystem II stability/assembly factor-like uncharacterized protein
MLLFMKQLLLPIFSCVAFFAFGQANIIELDVQCDTNLTDYEYIDSPTADVVWAAGQIGAGTTAQGTQAISRSIDGGLSFTNSTIPTPSEAWRFSNFEAYSADIAFATFFNGASKGKVYKTTDGGATWVDKTMAGMFTGTAAFANWSHFFDDQEGMSMGDPTGPTGGASGIYFEIWQTTNGGDAWTRIPKANLPAILSTETGITDYYDAIGDNLWFTTTKGRCVYSNDKGATWKVVQTPLAAAFKIHFANTLDGMGFLSQTSLATPSSIITTHDGGATWTATEDAFLAIDPQTSASFFIQDADYVPNTSILIGSGAGDGAYNCVAASIDHGLSWYIIDEGTYRGVVTMANKNVGYFGAQTVNLKATMYKLDDILLPTVTVSQPIDFSAYPNPANDVLEITSNILQNLDLWFTISGSTGQIISRELWKNTGGSFSRTISTKDFPNGVYTIQASDGNNTVFHKIVIIH